MTQEKHHGSNEHDRKESHKIAEKARIKNNTPFITMPSGEKYSLTGKCLVCMKRIWIGHMCYTCATDLPRLILRKEEMQIQTEELSP